jgi:T5SS/PEP-CTERM-associated repeat protein
MQPTIANVTVPLILTTLSLFAAQANAQNVAACAGSYRGQLFCLSSGTAFNLVAGAEMLPDGQGCLTAFGGGSFQAHESGEVTRIEQPTGVSPVPIVGCGGGARSVSGTIDLETCTLRLLDADNPNQPPRLYVLAPVGQVPGPPPCPDQPLGICEEEEEEEEGRCVAADVLEASWVEPLNGSLSDPLSWEFNPVQDDDEEVVPGAQDNVTFNIDGVSSYEVSLTADATHASATLVDPVNLNLNNFTYTLAPCTDASAVDVVALSARVDGGGTLHARGDVDIRPQEGTPALITFADDSHFKIESGDLSVGDGGSAAVLAVTAGAELTTSGNTFLSNGSISVTGPSGWSAADECQIGSGGSGGVSIGDGGEFSANHDLTVFVGGIVETPTGPRSTGEVTVSGSGSTWIQSGGVGIATGQLVLGAGPGSGQFVLENGGNVIQGVDTTLGLDLGTGSITVTGAGTLWDSADELHVAEGTDSFGDISVLAGGEARFSEAQIGTGLRSEGLVSVDGGDSKMTISGGMTIASLGVADVDISNGGTLSAASARIGAVLASEGIAKVRGQNSSLATSGDLIVGEAGTGEVRVTDGGRVNVGGKLIVGDRGVGTLNILDGTVVSSSSVIAQSLAPVRSKGTVNVGAKGVWLNTGLLAVGDILAGGEATLNIDPEGLMITNTFIASASGTVNGKVITASGAAQTVLDSLLDGNSPRGTNQSTTPPTGLITNTLTIESGSTIDVEQVILEEGGTLAGEGRFKFALSNPGVLSPGVDDCTAGRLVIDGDYTQAAGGQLRIKLGGSEPGSTFDQLQVEGTANLAGTLVVTAVDGFSPAVGSQFDVLTARSIVGSFDEIESSAEFELAYSADRLTLTVLASPTEVGSRCTQQESDPVGQGGAGLCGIASPATLLLMCVGMGLVRGRRHVGNGSFHANVNIGDRAEGSWQGFPVVSRSLEFYNTEAAARNGLTVRDLGTLGDLGHQSGFKLQDAQRMLEFRKR